MMFLELYMAGILVTYVMLKMVVNPGPDAPFLEFLGTDKKTGEMLFEIANVITSICWPIYWSGCIIIRLLSK